MPSPIFILGSMGSGSTLIRLMLDSHERIAIPQETSFMRLVQAHRWVPHWRYGDRFARRLDLTSDQLDAYLRSFYGGLFERYARLHGKERWGEKTPHHIWHIEAMAELFPDSVFLGIVRHPGGTTGSLVGRFNFETQRGVRHWLNHNKELVHQGARLGDRFGLVRYEDLVRQPEQVMRETLTFLGEPWSDGVLRHHEVQQQQGARKVIDGGTRPADPLDESRASRWKSRFNEVEIRYIRNRTSGWAGFFGYDVDEPFPVEALVPDGAGRSWLITGGELAQRRDAFAGRLDFTPPARPPQDEPILHGERQPMPPLAAPAPTGLRRLRAGVRRRAKRLFRG